MTKNITLYNQKSYSIKNTQDYIEKCSPVVKCIIELCVIIDNIGKNYMELCKLAVDTKGEIGLDFNHFNVKECEMIVCHDFDFGFGLDCDYKLQSNPIQNLYTVVYIQLNFLVSVIAEIMNNFIY